MALLGSMTKQPGEVLPIDINYASVIAGRAVTSVTPTVTVPAGMVMDSAVVTGETLQIYCSGGSTSTSYRWVVKTDIVIGGKTTTVEDEFDIVIAEVSNV